MISAEYRAHLMLAVLNAQASGFTVLAEAIAEMIRKGGVQ